MEAKTNCQHSKAMLSKLSTKVPDPPCQPSLSADLDKTGSGRSWQIPTTAVVRGMVEAEMLTAYLATIKTGVMPISSISSTDISSC